MPTITPSRDAHLANAIDAAFAGLPARNRTMSKHTPGTLSVRTEAGDPDQGVSAWIECDNPGFTTSLNVGTTNLNSANHPYLVWPQDVANVERLVLAWNCHDELLAALRMARDYIADIDGVEDVEDEDGQPMGFTRLRHDCEFRTNPEAGNCSVCDMWTAVAIAIAKAEGK